MGDSLWSAERLDALRDGRGFSARDIARRLGVASATTVWRWLNGAGEPRYTDAVRLAQLFGVDLRAFARPEAGELPGPAANGEGLSDDERFILTLIRDLGLGRAEVVRLLASRGGGGESDAHG